ncbi:MAG: response regulator [Ignavibacteria bacterium]|nr:response regulator [Ignavibacteria bacterium]
MRILVVDDNKGFLDVMAQLLRDYGYEVFVAEDGKQAREFLEIEKVDLIISDVFMPTLDGTRFHSYVREFTDARDVPFIFISGYDDEQTRNVVVNSEIDFFFNKTTPVETIVDLIEKLRVVNQTGPI